MRFYGNGVVRLDRDNRVQFSRPKIKYEKGFVDVKEDKICNKLIALGYEYDPVKEPVKKTKPKPVKPVKKEIDNENSED